MDRFESIADKDGKIKIEPHQVDGLSYVMTIVYMIYNYGFKQFENMNIVLMGSSGKGEILYNLFINLKKSLFIFEIVKFLFNSGRKNFCKF